MLSFKMTFLTIVFSLMMSTKSFAHDMSEGQHALAEGLHVDLSIAGAYRSDALVKQNERWVIPGTLMGGEALPSSAGLGLDEVFLTPVYKREQTYVLLKFGRHLGSEELELDHVLLGYEWTPNLTLEGGRMAAQFTPFNGEHTSDTSFSSRRLVYDALWGGQFTDEGLRVKGHFWDIDAGLEVWKGGSFPAKEKDSNKSAYDLYLRKSFGEDHYHLQVGAFYFATDANARDDSRYSSGHSHSTTIVTTDPSYFDGKIDTKGIFLSHRFALSTNTTLGYAGELSQIQQDGRLWDATHEAQFKNRSTGLWGEVFASVGSEQLSFRSERLKVKNDIYGVAARALADKLSLLSAIRDPYRHTLSFEHRFAKQFRTRLEWSKDFSTATKKDIYTVGAVWSDSVFPLAGL